MIALLLLLYPAAWRRRYGDEFAAVLEARKLGPFDMFDVVLAAIDAHLHLRGQRAAGIHQGGFAMSTRLGGGAAILGGALFAIGFAWASLDPADSDPGFVVLLAGLVALLVGLVGLSAFQARRHPRLIWAAFAVPALGVVLLIVGLIAMGIVGDRAFVGELGGWEFFFLGLIATFVGSGLFGLATLRTRALPWPGAALLAGTSVGGVGAAVFSIVGGPTDVLAPVVLLGFALGWVSLGWSALTAKGGATAAAA